MGDYDDFLLQQLLGPIISGNWAFQDGFTLLKFVMALADQCGLGEACMIPSLAPTLGYLTI